MPQGSVEVLVAGHELTLLPDGAIYWRERSALLVADLHVGKGASFRADAVPIPSGSSLDTLSALSRVLDATGAKRLLMLGDFWHAKRGRTDLINQAVAEWRHRHSGLEMLLVEGNHDRRSGEFPLELGIETVADLVIDGFVLKHHPEEDERGYVLCGHIHPAVRMIGQGRQVAKLPAFWFGSRVGVLPAFGEFTGDATVYPAAEDRVFVIADGDVVEVSLTGAGVM